MTDLDDLHHFHGIVVTHSSKGHSCPSESTPLTPIDTWAKLCAIVGSLVSDPSRSLARKLQYLMLTRPGLAYAIQQVCLFMHVPREPHLMLIKRILLYVKGTLSSRLHIGTELTLTLTA